MKLRKIFAFNLLIDTKGNEFTNFVQLKHRQSNSNACNFWNIQLIRIHQARDWRLQNILSVLSFIANISDRTERETGRKAELVLDNAPAHKSSLSTETIREQRQQLAFLLAYGPEFTPVELIFGCIKSKMKRQGRSGSYNFGKECKVVEVV